MLWPLLLAALLAAGCGKSNVPQAGDPPTRISVGAVPPTHAPASAGDRTLALAVARSLVGAVRVSSRPISLEDVPRASPIRSAPGRPATPNVVDVDRIWRVPGRPRAALAAVRHSHPAGLLVNGEGSGGRHGVGEREVEYFWYVSFQAPPRPGLGSEQLSVSMTAAPGGGTLLRADGQVVWLNVRSAAERVPAGVSSIEVTRGAGHGRASLRRTITAAASVARIVTALDRLPIVQPGTVVCPDEQVQPLVVHLIFRSAQEQTLAQASQAAGPEVDGCAPMRFSVGGRELQPLSGGAGVIDIVDRALGLRLLGGLRGTT